jgi:hypothetical protein
MDAMAQRMAQAQGQRGQTPEMTFRAKVDDTGASKDVNGVRASQKIMTLTGETAVNDEKSGTAHTMGTVIESEMWMAADIPGYDEVRRFYQRMGEKFGRVFGGAAGLNVAPGMAAGFAELAKESAKLKGIPVYQVTRMSQTIDGKPMPGFGGMQMPPGKDMAGNAAGDAAAGTALGRMGRIGGLAGGLGGLSRRGRKDDQQAQQQQAPPPDAPPAGPMMETTTEMTRFTPAPVDSSKFAVPAGFKQVDSEMKRFAKER